MNKINTVIENHNLVDIWRVENPYTWHSNTKAIIFIRLDFTLTSNYLNNFVKGFKIKTGYKWDHSTVLLKELVISNSIFPYYSTKLLDCSTKRSLKKNKGLY